MYLEGTAVAWILFLLGFLSCGLLSLGIWCLVSFFSTRAVLKRLEELLREE